MLLGDRITGASAGRWSGRGPPSPCERRTRELNQPLTAIANYVEAARDMLETPPDKETLATIREALDECAAQSVRAGQIVRRLRDFIARGESERRVESLQRLITEASALALVGAGEQVGRHATFPGSIRRMKLAWRTRPSLVNSVISISAPSSGRTHVAPFR